MVGVRGHPVTASANSNRITVRELISVGASEMLIAVAEADGVAK